MLLRNPGKGNSDDPYRQLDQSAFTFPSVGSQGFESGRNFLRVAPLNSWDAALSKEFRIKERVRLEARLDAFNAFNHTQFDGVFSTLNVTSLSNPTPTNIASETGNRNGFGAISSTRLPRNLQWSVRFQF